MILALYTTASLQFGVAAGAATHLARVHEVLLVEVDERQHAVVALVSTIATVIGLVTCPMHVVQVVSTWCIAVELEDHIIGHGNTCCTALPHQRCHAHSLLILHIILDHVRQQVLRLTHAALTLAHVSTCWLAHHAPRAHFVARTGTRLLLLVARVADFVGLGHYTVGLLLLLAHRIVVSLLWMAHHGVLVAGTHLVRLLRVPIHGLHLLLAVVHAVVKHLVLTVNVAHFLLGRVHGRRLRPPAHTATVLVLRASHLSHLLRVLLPLHLLARRCRLLLLALDVTELGTLHSTANIVFLSAHSRTVDVTKTFRLTFEESLVLYGVSELDILVARHSELLIVVHWSIACLLLRSTLPRHVVEVVAACVIGKAVAASVRLLEQRATAVVVARSLLSLLAWGLVLLLRLIVVNLVRWLASIGLQLGRILLLLIVAIRRGSSHFAIIEVTHLLLLLRGQALLGCQLLVVGIDLVLVVHKLSLLLLLLLLLRELDVDELLHVAGLLGIRHLLLRVLVHVVAISIACRIGSTVTLVSACIHAIVGVLVLGLLSTWIPKHMLLLLHQVRASHRVG